jgi:Ca-activated chloride channel family protein
MILRDSEFKGTSTYDMIIELAKASKGADTEGYRDEFIRLVEIAKLLDKK